jgi:hypothetical protein
LLNTSMALRSHPLHVAEDAKTASPRHGHVQNHEVVLVVLLDVGEKLVGLLGFGSADLREQRKPTRPPDLLPHPP